jgi:hypothetical protein
MYNKPGKTMGLRTQSAFLCAVIIILLSACSGSIPTLYTNPYLLPNEDRSGCVITSPPEELDFDPFYSKYCNAAGIGIVASEEVDDLTLQQAYYIINNLLSPIPNVLDQLVDDGHYIASIGKDQEQTTLPEYSHMDSSYWDARARGLGAGRGVLVTSCGEENLLCQRRDSYFGENILVHEFAHTIHLSGQGSSFNEFNRKLSKLYYKARKEGLWENTYAITNPEEYWAEGIQGYFNTNLSSPFPDGVHNKVDTREELAEYDPDLFGFIAEFYDYFAWKPTCPH